MSKSSGFAPTPQQGLSRPSSPGPALGAGFDKDEDRQALMMGPMGESRRNDVSKDAAAGQAGQTPASTEQSEYQHCVCYRGR